MSTFGEVLKGWRQQKRMSQMALALAADVSTRHVSYLETGKAAPSKQMVLRLMNALSVPSHDRNEWLTSAGFAPIYSRRSLESDELAPYWEAVRRLLDTHDPYPGWALDHDWRIVMANTTGARLLGYLGLTLKDSLVSAIAADPTLDGKLLNWSEAVKHLSKRLLSEARRRSDTALSALAGKLTDLDTSKPAFSTPSIAVPTLLEILGQRIELTSLQAVFNTAEDLALSDLRIELFYPIDATSKKNLASVLSM